MAVASGTPEAMSEAPPAASARDRLAVASALAPRRSSGRATAVRAALRRVAVGRLDASEREWVARIENRRASLAASADRFTSPIPEDGGRAGGSAPATVGSATVRGSSGSVAQASRAASVSPVFGELLMALVRGLEPTSCLELGTGFGISGAYQGAGLALNGSGELVTLEGSPDISAIAGAGFEELELDRIEPRVGMLQDELEATVRSTTPIDFAFIDAHHDEPMTLRCFECVAQAASPGAALVFDDIRWSAAMRRAWRRVAADNRTAATFDVRRMGICILRGPV